MLVISTGPYILTEEGIRSRWIPWVRNRWSALQSVVIAFNDGGRGCVVLLLSFSNGRAPVMVEFAPPLAADRWPRIFYAIVHRAPEGASFCSRTRWLAGLLPMGDPDGDVGGDALAEAKRAALCFDLQGVERSLWRNHAGLRDDPAALRLRAEAWAYFGGSTPQTYAVLEEAIPREENSPLLPELAVCALRLDNPEGPALACAALAAFPDRTDCIIALAEYHRRRGDDDALAAIKMEHAEVMRAYADDVPLSFRTFRDDRQLGGRSIAWIGGTAVLFVVSVFLFFGYMLFVFFQGGREHARLMAEVEEQMAASSAMVEETREWMREQGMWHGSDAQLRLAAREGDALAQYEKGRRYLRGSDRDRDMTKAVHWFRASAEQGYPRAMQALGSALRDYPREAPDFEGAVHWLRKAHEAGGSGAAIALADLFREGPPGIQDTTEALRYYEISAVGGNAFAASWAGFLHQHGEGIPPDYEKAAHFHRIAIEGGYDYNKLDLARLHFRAVIEGSELLEGLKLLLSSAEAGIQSAVRYTIAFGWVADAALSDSEALSLLSEYIGSVEDVTPAHGLALALKAQVLGQRGDDVFDADRAFSAAGRAAEAHPHGTYVLGQFHHFGIGTPVDTAESIILLESAAATGHRDSMRALAFHLRNGIWIDADWPRAYDLLEELNMSTALASLFPNGRPDASPAIPECGPVPDLGRHPPRPLRQFTPVFPAPMQRARVSGEVTLAFVVNIDGRVESAEVIHSTNEAFSYAALSAVRRWIFCPGHDGGHPQATPVRIRIPFELTPAEEDE